MDILGTRKGRHATQRRVTSDQTKIAWKRQKRKGKFPARPKACSQATTDNWSWPLMRLILVQEPGVLPDISHIGMCHYKGMVLTPFWPADGYRPRGGGGGTAIYGLYRYVPL